MVAMHVKRLPKDPGPAAWNRLLDAPDPAKPLEENISADWLIIGAGFAGLAAAKRLKSAQPQARIVILDAVRIADGPAGRNSGFMIDLPHNLSSNDYGGYTDKDQAQTQDNRMAIEFVGKLAEELGLPEEAFHRSGKINAAASEKGEASNTRYAAHLESMGQGYEFLDAQTLRDLTGTDYYRSGLYTPGAAIIQPAMYVRAVAKHLLAIGVAIHENSPVLKLERRDDWVATTDRANVTAPKVILAVNGHLNSFGFAKRQLMHVFTYGSMTRRLSPDEVKCLGGVPRWGVLPSDPMGSTVRRISGTGGDRLMVRNRFTFNPSMEIDERRLNSISREHYSAFEARFPMLPDVEMEFSWGGRLCLSMNDVQIVREVDEQLYAACCQNGLGTTRGTFAGILAADLSLGHTSDALSRMLNAEAPQRLPPEPIASIGASLKLRWGAHRAGSEV